jgi:phosphoketolase
MKKEVEKALQEEMPEMGIRVVNLIRNMKIFDEDKTAAG